MERRKGYRNGYKPRTLKNRVVRIFPNEQSCVRLVSALAIETNEEWMARRYLTMDDEKEVSESTTDTLAA